VTVKINSGNPRYPFPQFLDYGIGRASLASHNPVGVTHAEMEQRIRDAWQIMSNLFVYSGESLGGIQYIHYQSSPDCTEGDGYALIAAAYMGDKQTFDGLWLWMHDHRMNKVRSYIACPTMINGGYFYGQLPGWTGSGANSAADGDYDMALGLLMAWYQWGDNMGINDACATPISYKTDALAMIKALVEPDEGDVTGDCAKTSGDIGYDGYFKGGNTWKESTAFATGQCPNGPQFAGPQNEHMDYTAPAYFNCFASTLLGQGYAAGSFEVTQFQRGEASSDWLMGQEKAQGLIPFAGWVDLGGGTPAFSNYSDGEDFRNGWRTALNYVWNGNPATHWDPVGHQVVAGGNTNEYDEAGNFASFLKNPQSLGQACMAPGSAPITFNGIATAVYYYSPTGVPATTFTLNWVDGTGAPSAVAAQDFDLMAKMFRQCVIEWDVSSAGDGYLTSVPIYFHDFFRLLGMEILSGNLPSPCSLVAPGAGSPPANMKVYKAVNKTYAFTGDQVTYWINYRNFASVAATGVQVQDILPAGESFVSAVPAPASTVGGTITWNLGSVPGLQNQNYAATEGGITLTVQVSATTGRLCNVATVSCANGSGWTSNEYPNDQTAVMERNCVDIIPAALSLTKTANTNMANPGDTVTFTIAYANNPAPWLNGGRPGVTAAFANNGDPASNSTEHWMFRLYHAAEEAYIDYHNYRISYFLYDPSYGAGSWTFGSSGQPTIYEGGSAITLTEQNLIPGTAANGLKWNQRVIVQFDAQLATIASHLWNYYGMPARIHQGGLQPLRATFDMHLNSYAATNWSDDWSADPAAVDTDGGAYFPITNDWTDPYNPNLAVTKVDADACQTASHQVNNVLVEEWDGYTWRRAFGDGPISGREMDNVLIVDTLPAGLTFGGFVGTTGTVAGNVITWSIPLLRINDSGTLSYYATVANAAYFGGCPVSTTLVNPAQISATNESPIHSSASISVTCNALPTPVPAFNKSGPAGPVAVGASIPYVISYSAPTPLGLVTDTFSANTIANWTNQQGSAGWAIAGGVLAGGSWGGGTITNNASNAANTTVTAHISIPAYAYGGVVFRATAANTYYYVEVMTTNNGQSQVFFKKSVGGTVTTIQSTAANLTIPGATFFGVQVWANGNSFTIGIDTGGGFTDPFGGPIIDSSIAGPGTAGIRSENDPGVQATDFSATVDRLTGVSIYDTTPANTTYQSSAPAANAAPAVGATGLVRWDLGTILQGTTYSVTLTVQVASCPGSGNVVNQATLSVVNALSNDVTTTVSCGGTPTYTPTRTASPSASPSPSPSNTVSASPTRTASPSPSPSATVTLTPSPVASPTFTPTASPSFSGSPTASPSRTATASPSATPTASPSATVTPTATDSPAYTATGTPSATMSFSPSDTPSATATLTATRTATLTASPTPSFTPTPTASDSPTQSCTFSPSPSFSPSSTPTASPTVTLTRTPTATATVTSSATPSASPTPSSTVTRTASPTPTVTLTATASATVTQTPTISPTFSISPTHAVVFYQQPALVVEKGIYPNPFSDTAKLYFNLREAAHLSLQFYNVAGEAVYHLDLDGTAGQNQALWQGINQVGARCASGVYILHLTAVGTDDSKGDFWADLVIMR